LGSSLVGRVFDYGFLSFALVILAVHFVDLEFKNAGIDKN
jgi:hypothetical protein